MYKNGAENSRYVGLCKARRKNEQKSKKTKLPALIWSSPAQAYNKCMENMIERWHACIGCKCVKM